MKSWYTTKQLAGLDGLPATPKGVIDKARREEWQSRPRSAQGGGLEYHINALPITARRQLAAMAASVTNEQHDGKNAGLAENIKQDISAQVAGREKQQSLQRLAGLTGQSKARATARLEVLGAFDRYHQSSALRVTAARSAFVSDYNQEAITVSAATRTEITTLSLPSLIRWQKTLKNDGPAALAGNYGNRAGSSQVDQDRALHDFVLGMITERPHTTAQHALTTLKARFKDTKLPSKRAMQRWINSWRADHHELYTAVTNPDAWKNNYMLALGKADEDINRLNQRWEFDSTPADVMLLDGRHQILGVIDVYSRRVKLHISRTSKASAVAHLIRSALLDWGVPEVAKTDNGAEYISTHIEQVFLSLGVEQQLCTPFQAWEKPFIERFFHTFSHSFLELVEGYIGHNVAERQQIESRKSFSDRLLQRDQVIDIALTADELQNYCDRWTEDLYHHQTHSKLRTTPFAKAAEWTGPIRTITEPRALDLLLAAPPGKRLPTVGKKGIRLDNCYYIAAELADHARQQVSVRYDPEDMGRIYVYSAIDGSFVCVAEDPDITGVSRQEVAAIARERQKTRVQEARRELKRNAKKQDLREIAEEILNHAHQAKNVTAFPQRSIEHQSAGLDAAAEALEATKTPALPGASVTPINQQDHQALQAQFHAQESKPVGTDDNRRRYAYWLRLDRRVAADQRLKNEEWEFYHAYQKASEFRSMREFFNEFDLTADDFQ